MVPVIVDEVIKTRGRTWRAQPRQAQFLVTKEDEVLYGGAKGGGKTDALLAFMIMSCQQYPGFAGLFLRRTYHDLSLPKAAIDRSHQLLTGYAKWNGETYTWEFRDKNSKFTFGHLENDTDVHQYAGAQPDSLALDEATQFSEYQLEFMRMVPRTVLPGLKPKIRYGTNPGGVGHGYMKKRFLAAAPPNTPFVIRQGKTITTARFIPARVEDNVALMEADPGYVQRLDSLPEKLRKAFREGNWDVFEGQFFTEWDYSRHVCKPFAIPSEWEKWRAYDYGMGQPGASLWLAKAPSQWRGDAIGTVYVYREFYPRGITASEQGRLIREVTRGEHIRYSVGDPACFSRQPNGITIAQDLAIGLQPANNDRKAGWQKVHEFLWHDQTHEPKLQVFETCYNLIRTLPMLLYDPHKPEDVDTAGEDHLGDTLRYALMGATVKRHKTHTFDFAVGV